jgi:virulence-associated protein VagC
MATTTKVFKSGGSQAVWIPKEYRLEGDTVTLDRAGEGLLLPASRAGKRAGARASVRPRRPGFLKGLKIAKDFDAPLPARILKTFAKA